MATVRPEALTILPLPAFRLSKLPTVSDEISTAWSEAPSPPKATPTPARLAAVERS